MTTSDTASMSRTKSFDYVTGFSVRGVPEHVVYNPLDHIRLRTGLYASIGPGLYNLLAGRILSDEPDVRIEVFRSRRLLGARAAREEVERRLYTPNPVLSPCHFHGANVHLSNYPIDRKKTTGKRIVSWLRLEDEERAVWHVPRWCEGGTDPELVPEGEAFNPGTLFLIAKG